MKKFLINKMVSLLLGALSPEVLRNAVDALLDSIENAVEGSGNKVDDAIVLPLCNLVREAFDVPDDD